MASCPLTGQETKLWHVKSSQEKLPGKEHRFRVEFASIASKGIMEMTKEELVKAIIAKLNHNLGILERAARAAHAEATHESSKAENKYDTRGLEASYLAGGQSR